MWGTSERTRRRRIGRPENRRLVTAHTGILAFSPKYMGCLGVDNYSVAADAAGLCVFS